MRVRKEGIVTVLFMLILIGISLFFLYYINNEFTGSLIYEGLGEGQTTLKLLEEGENLGDVYVAGDSANTNHNSKDYLLVKWGTPKRNTYLKFNLSDVPENQEINDAVLCLYLWNDQSSPNASAYHVYSDFNESALTWNTQPCGTNFDNSDNCNLTAESTVLTDKNQDDTWQCWSVVNMVSEQYSNQEDEISIVLHTDASGNADKYYPREHSNSSLIPYLNITYSSNDNENPIIILDYPDETIDLNEVVFNYTPTDANLESCELWGNFTGVFEKNQTNLSVISGQINEFNLTLCNGSYLWAVFCNDSFGNSVFSDNNSFVIKIIEEESEAEPEEAQSPPQPLPTSSGGGGNDRKKSDKVEENVTQINESVEESYNEIIITKKEPVEPENEELKKGFIGLIKKTEKFLTGLIVEEGNFKMHWTLVLIGSIIIAIGILILIKSRKK